MLESVLDFEEVNKRPYLIFFWAFVLASVGIAVSTQVAPSVSSIDFGFFAVLFTILPSMYLITVLIQKEEELEEEEIREHYSMRSFWGRHEKDILTLLFYFGGLTLAFAVWTFILPDSFGAQVAKINEIVPVPVGQITGAATSPAAFWTIFQNNLQVMVVSFVFSLLFGAGMVFILVWNASVLGVYIGKLSEALWGIPLVSLRFIPHGVPEIAGYLAAGLAGGILSAALLRKNSHHVIEVVIIDSLELLAVGVLFLLGAALIEVYL